MVLLYFDLIYSSTKKVNYTLDGCREGSRYPRCSAQVNLCTNNNLTQFYMFG